MKRMRGNMWEEYSGNPKHLFLFTSNSDINGRGALIMGAGSARQARDKFAGLSMELGKRLSRMQSEAGIYDVEYGLIISHTHRVGAFQTKNSWRSTSKIGLVKLSTAMLIKESSSWEQVHLPYPGIGLGKLSVSQVEPIISCLPDNVFVWTYN